MVDFDHFFLLTGGIRGHSLWQKGECPPMPPLVDGGVQLSVELGVNMPTCSIDCTVHIFIITDRSQTLGGGADAKENNHKHSWALSGLMKFQAPLWYENDGQSHGKSFNFSIFHWKICNSFQGPHKTFKEPPFASCPPRSVCEQSLIVLKESIYLIVHLKLSSQSFNIYSCTCVFSPSV